MRDRLSLLVQALHLAVSSSTNPFRPARLGNQTGSVVRIFFNTMKNTLLTVTTACFICALCASCTTARHTAEGATDVAAHAVEKTGHAVAHGAEKVENNL